MGIKKADPELFSALDREKQRDLLFHFHIPCQRRQQIVIVARCGLGSELVDERMGVTVSAQQCPHTVQYKERVPILACVLDPGSAGVIFSVSQRSSRRSTSCGMMSVFLKITHIRMTTNSSVSFRKASSRTVRERVTTRRILQSENVSERNISIITLL